MRAERSLPECSICHRTVHRNMERHLHEHTKAELVDELLRYYEDEEWEE